MKNVVLIDSDSLSYLGQKDDTLQQIIEKVDYKIQAILDETNADYYCLFVSQGKYFRHDLKDKSEESGSYKSNRKYSNQNYNRVIKEYLIAQYGAVSYPNIEADDAISYWMNKPIFYSEGTEQYINKPFWVFTTKEYTEILNEKIGSKNINKILAAVDKDLLKSIPGRHLVYNKKQGDEWGMEWVETSENDAIEFKKMQLIVGDASDGVTGIPGRGIKYWENVVMKDGFLPSMSTILNAYGTHYSTIGEAIYQFQKNYRLLHLLDCDEDFMREVGYIPELPTFREVTKQNIEIKNEF